MAKVCMICSAQFNSQLTSDAEDIHFDILQNIFSGALYSNSITYKAMHRWISCGVVELCEGVRTLHCCFTACHKWSWVRQWVSGTMWYFIKIGAWRLGTTGWELISGLNAIFDHPLGTKQPISNVTMVLHWDIHR